ncbi:phage tail tape measure protein [Macrococcus brunensis]|uniref:lysostaphin n=1 Tax=Macrococcus brunensis TaxID=198483 RepID=A0A4R6BCW6_9STAP|nr:phage tail tape measure protein [Macrococcus brunensis]TDL96681.1 phage tail tape measure protein [Macrococcus brunensis]
MADEQIKGLSIGIDLNDMGIDRTLTDIRRSFRSLSGDIKLASNELKYGEKSMDSYKNNIRTLDSAIKLQTKNVEDLRDRYNKLANEQGANSKAAIAARNEFNKQLDVLNKTKRELNGVVDDFKEFQQAERKAADEAKYLESQLGKAQTAMKNMSPKLSGIGDGLKDIGRQATIGMSVPLLAGFGAAIKTSADFESQMSRVGAIAGTTKGEFEQLKKQAMDLGASTSKSASEVAAGMENLAAMGFNAKEIMGAMPGVISASESSGADMAQTADVMAAAINGFGLKASDATHVADVLAQTANQSAADITDMQYALKYAAGPAHALKIPLEETSAAIGIMTDAGLDGSNAGTALRGSLLSLLDPSEENSKRMEAMGIQLEDSNGKFVGISGVIGQFKQKMDGMTDSQKAANLSALVGKESVSGFLTLMEAGPSKIDKMTKSLKDSGGASAEAAKKMKDNLKGALDELGGAVETAGIKIGDLLSPAIRGIAESIGKAINVFNNLPKSMQLGITVFGLLAAAIGPIILGIGTVISILGTAAGVIGGLSPAIMGLLGPIGIAVGVITGLGIAFTVAYQKSETFRNIVNSAIQGVMGTFRNLGSIIKGVFQLFQGNGTQGVITLSKFFPPGLVVGIAQTVDMIKRSVMSAVKAVSDFAGQIGRQISTFWQQNGSSITAAVRNVGKIIATVFQGILAVFRFVWPLAAAVIRSVWENIKGIISGGLRIIQGLVKVFSGIFTGDFKKIWEGVKDIFFGAIQVIWNWVQLQFLGKILKGVGAFSGTFKTLFVNVWKLIKGIFSGTISAIVKSSLNFFTNLSKGTSSIFNGILKFIGNTLSALKKTIIEGAKNSVKGAMGNFSSLFKNGTKLFSDLRTHISNSWTGLKKTAIDAAVKLKDGVTGPFKALWGNIKTLSGNISSSVTGMKDKVIGAAKALASGLKTHAIGGLNKMIDGVNWVGNKLGMGDNLIPRLSTGTGATKKDMLAVVGDRGPGNGAGGATQELIRYPNGQIELTPATDTLRFLPKGSTVFNGDQTLDIMRMMSKNDNEPGAGGPFDFLNPIKDYAGEKLNQLVGFGQKKLIESGTNLVDNSTKMIGAKKTAQVMSSVAKVGAPIKETAEEIYDLIQDPSKLVGIILKRFGVDFSGITAVPGKIMGAGFNSLKKGMMNTFKKWGDESGGAASATGGILDPNLISYFFGHTEAYTRTTGRQWHEGVDFPFVYQPLKTPMGGTLTRQPFMAGGYGNWVTVDNGGTRLIFGHLRDYGRSPSSGTRVKPGDIVGTSGNTGFSTGPHLHFGVKQNGVDINPLPWLRAAKPKAHANGGMTLSNGFFELNETHPEYIVPTDPSKRTQAMKLWSLIGQKLRSGRSLQTDQLPNPGSFSSNEQHLLKMMGMMQEQINLLNKLLLSNQNLEKNESNFDENGFARRLNQKIKSMNRLEERFT